MYQISCSKFINSRIIAVKQCSVLLLQTTSTNLSNFLLCCYSSFVISQKYNIILSAPFDSMREDFCSLHSGPSFLFPVLFPFSMSDCHVSYLSGFIKLRLLQCEVVSLTLITQSRGPGALILAAFPLEIRLLCDQQALSGHSRLSN